MEQQELAEDASALAKAIVASAVHEGLPLAPSGRTLGLLRAVCGRFEAVIEDADLEPFHEEALLRESERTSLVIESLAELCTTIVNQLAQHGVVITNLPEILASPFILPDVD